MKVLITLLGLTLAVCAGCGGDGGTGPGTPPSVPAGLTAQGSLGQIELSWQASSGSGLTGYNVYRSGGAGFAKINATPVAGLTYQDTDVYDGVYYSYKVTSVGQKESDYSAVVRCMHGTRLLDRYESDCVLTGALSPFVAEDSVAIAGGNIEIQTGAALYILDSAVVYFEFVSGTSNRAINVHGLLRVESPPSSPAKISAWAVDGSNMDGKGYALKFYDDAVDYNPVSGGGSLIQNCYLESICQGDGAILVWLCSARFYNCRISSSKSTGGSYFTIQAGGVPIVENCHIYRVVLTIRTDLRGTGALITNNVCRDGYYSIYFSGPVGPEMVDPGQVAYNDFDGTVNGLYMFQVDEGEIPLGNNHWDGGLPELVGGAGTVDFAPVLEEPPSGCGPTW